MLAPLLPMPPQQQLWFNPTNALPIMHQALASLPDAATVAVTYTRPSPPPLTVCSAWVCPVCPPALHSLTRALRAPQIPGQTEYASHQDCSGLNPT